ncbi:MAG: Mov34/MPN/PAD-1 family protein [Dehalococcoidia bacterium]
MDSPVIEISRLRWRRLVSELARRGRRERESGAFLLARAGCRTRRVAAIVPYDDLDARCLVGGIDLDGSAFARLWALCAGRDLRVIADVHTHPGQGVAQSATDARHPMVATRGHLAIIVPNFAQGRPAPRECGVHVYEGGHRWRSHLPPESAALLRRTLW